jgi:hypothetical protein
LNLIDNCKQEYPKFRGIIMNNKIKFAVIGVCALGMSSCVVMENSTTANLVYPNYPSYDSNQYYMQNYYSSSNYRYNYNYKYDSQPRQEVVVPDSYHVGSMRSPVSFHDRDESWVNSQNPQAYTIELTEGDKPSSVAQKLYKTPKNDRMAQVKYQRDGKERYRGVYGTYNSAAEAQKALDALPAEIKNGASVKSWGSVQQP